MSKSIDYPSASEAELVETARGGDLSAFEELVTRYRDKVYTRAYNMVRSREDAVDLSQDAWVKAWRKLGQFQGDAKFITWITRITINLCLDHIRKRKKKGFVESVEQLEEERGGLDRHLPPVVTDPTEGLERQELRDRIDAALSKLTEAQRTVLVLYEFEQLEYKEIARRVGCSIGTVMSRLFYGRRKLAALLRELREQRGS